MSKDQTPAIDRLLPLSLPIFHMLLSLSEGERHGYALKREALQRTNGKLNLASGALYRITPLGRRVLQAEAVRLRQLVRLAESTIKLPELA